MGRSSRGALAVVGLLAGCALSRYEMLSGASDAGPADDAPERPAACQGLGIEAGNACPEGSFDVFGDGSACEAAVKDVTLAGGASCALTLSGEVRCWGTAAHDIAPPGVVYDRLRQSSTFTCGLTQGRLQCWHDSAWTEEECEDFQACKFVELAVDDSRVCTIDDQGSLRCRPPPLPGLLAIAINPQLRLELGHFTQVTVLPLCAVTDGVVRCMDDDALVVAEVDARAPHQGSYVQVVAADFQACALSSDGIVDCWSESGSVAPPLSHQGGYVHVAMNERFLCAVPRQGGVDCWGWRYGDQDLDVGRPRTGSFTQVAIGGAHACAVREDGKLECWGTDGSRAASGYRPTTNDYLQLAAQCALSCDGTVDCWGVDGEGRTLAAAPSEGPYVQVQVGPNHRACAVLAGGPIECWGGTRSMVRHQGDAYVAVAVGWAGECGITESGAIDCWGESPGGVPPPNRGPYVAASLGNDHGCALTREGEVDCWGVFAHDEECTDSGCTADIGDAGVEGLTPERGRYVQVVAEGRHTCALSDGGVVDCWGDALWQPVPGGRPHQGDYVVLTTDCALTREGGVDCWGSGQNYGQAPSERHYVDLSFADIGMCGLSDTGAFGCWTRWAGYVPTSRGALTLAP